MNNDPTTVVSVALTRRHWSAIFVGQLGYLYTILVERNKWIKDSEEWNRNQEHLRTAVDLFLPVLKEACTDDSRIDKAWFRFKLDAEMFPSDLLVDNAKKLIRIDSTG